MEHTINSTMKVYRNASYDELHTKCYRVDSSDYQAHCHFWVYKDDVESTITSGSLWCDSCTGRYGEFLYKRTGKGYSQMFFEIILQFMREHHISTIQLDFVNPIVIHAFFSVFGQYISEPEPKFVFTESVPLTRILYSMVVDISSAKGDYR